jgi:hypothetical protein
MRPVRLPTHSATLTVLAIAVMGWFEIMSYASCQQTRPQACTVIQIVCLGAVTASLTLRGRSVILWAILLPVMIVRVLFVGTTAVCRLKTTLLALLIVTVVMVCAPRMKKIRLPVLRIANRRF